MIKQNYLEDKQLCDWYIGEVIKCLPKTEILTSKQIWC